MGSQQVFGVGDGVPPMRLRVADAEVMPGVRLVPPGIGDRRWPPPRRAPSSTTDRARSSGKALPVAKSCRPSRRDAPASFPVAPIKFVAIRLERELVLDGEAVDRLVGVRS